jgi:hypothetical protein
MQAAPGAGVMRAGQAFQQPAELATTLTPLVNPSLFATVDATTALLLKSSLSRRMRSVNVDLEGL